MIVDVICPQEGSCQAFPKWGGVSQRYAGKGHNKMTIVNEDGLFNTMEVFRKNQADI